MSRRGRTSEVKSAKPGTSVDLRIIGGRLRGRKIEYSGDPRTRPMKDRVREALFNLIGPSIQGMHAIDLFAGTGALAFEAISRGAIGATMIEQHFPSADLIRRNGEQLEIAAICEVIGADAFCWWKRRTNLPATPWVVLCSPPFDFFESRTNDMAELISGCVEAAPAGSVVVVESPEAFDFATLPGNLEWDSRAYQPARLAIYRK
ncbi:MAG: RsmD family RNA methyltransferase [Planctomycetia bacterium]|nr:RsmD family RNA methyltransferase [Planctomycetia bacterium]